jgi:hypothetical protein
LIIWKYQYQVPFWTNQIRCFKYLLLLQQYLLLTAVQQEEGMYGLRKTTWPKALLCCVREVMFFKRSLNISELILIYFKYFYGIGCFLSSLKCLALTQAVKISQLVTEMWYWSGDPNRFCGFKFFTFHLKEKWTTMLQQWRKWRWASACSWMIVWMLYERKINEKEWHQATKPLTFLTLLPPIGAYKLLISLPCTSKLNRKIHLF